MDDHIKVIEINHTAAFIMIFLLYVKVSFFHNLVKKLDSGSSS